jgi:hypothetical protein
MMRLLIGDSLTNVKLYSNHQVKGRQHEAEDVMPLTQVARIDSRTRHRETKTEGQTEVLTFNAEYAPEETLSGGLQFALRDEGVNLQVLDGYSSVAARGLWKSGSRAARHVTAISLG